MQATAALQFVYCCIRLFEEIVLSLSEHRQDRLCGKCREVTFSPASDLTKMQIECLLDHLVGCRMALTQVPTTCFRPTEDGRRGTWLGVCKVEAPRANRNPLSPHQPSAIKHLRFHFVSKHVVPRASRLVSFLFTIVSLTSIMSRFVANVWSFFSIRTAS